MSERGWTVVNTKQKKVESSKKCKERKQKENAIAEASRKKFESELLQKSYSGFVEKTDAPKKQKKPKRSSLPHADGTVSETMFSAFSEVEERKMMNKKALKQLELKEGETQTKKKKKKSKKLSAKSACDSWDAVALQAQIDEIPGRYPNHHEYQVKSLAEIFEERLGKTSIGATSSALEEKTFDRRLEIPLCYLSDNIISIVTKWLQTIPEKELAGFCFWLLQEAYKTENRRSSSGLGLKMLIQIICFKLPTVSLRCIRSNAFQERFCVPASSWEALASKLTPDQFTKQPKTLPKILPPESKVLRPKMIKILVWFLGQAIKDTPSVALTYWFEFLLPLLCTSIPDYVYDLVFSYLAALYPRKSALAKHEFADEISVAALERLIIIRATMDDRTFDNSPFGAAYRFVEKFTLWSSKQSPHHFFPMLLRHAGSAPKARRDEILEKLVTCLAKDSASYELWRKVYPSFVAQSSNLVLYITENWDRLTGNEASEADEGNGNGNGNSNNGKPPVLLDPEEVLESVNKFLSINKQIQEGTFKLTGKQAGKKLWAKRDIEVCNVTCKKLTSKLGRSMKQKTKGGRSYVLYLFLMLLVVAACAFYVRHVCGDGKCKQEWCSLLLPACSPEAALRL